jgi:hypothetical protein
MNFRAIAYYLPQYYPTPENNRWWGEGFTEWTNVAKAKPLFKGHEQPRFPADLGYYDLRVAEVREEQAAIAKAYGVEGFMYYHYWFGNGKLLLEKPLQEVLRLKKPEFPFCLCWANQTWKGVWFGEFTGKTLVEQTYPGKEDYEKHFYYLLPAFGDERYIRVDGKPVFNVYMPLDLPSIPEFVDTFQTLATKEGFPGLHLIASRCPFDWNPLQHGFSGVIGSESLCIHYWKHEIFKRENQWVGRAKRFVNQKLGKELFVNGRKPQVIGFENIVDQLVTERAFDFDYYPCLIPNWDNTPRMGNKGRVFLNATPELFGKQLDKAIEKVNHLPEERRFIFIKSWNEWAEGNYLEPDRKWGYAYLEQIKQRRFNGTD